MEATTTMADVAQVRAVFALEKMPTRVRSDALADGSIAARFDLPVHSPVRILSSTVTRQELFARFREAADGQMPAPLLDVAGADLKACIAVGEAGDGVVRIGSTTLRFPHAALLGSDPAKRGALADRLLAGSTLSAPHESEFRTLIAEPAQAEKDFLDATGLLSTAPEFFAGMLQEKLERAKGNIGEADVLPDDPRHWENLTARVEGSADLPAFVGAELAAERKRQLIAHPLRGYRLMSLSFCAPALVPKELLDDLPIDTVLTIIEEIATCDDPFALVGSFEYCASSLQSDARFAVVGERLLERLAADMDWLQRAAAIWATGFVIATARLAVDAATSAAARLLATIGGGQPRLSHRANMRRARY